MHTTIDTPVGPFTIVGRGGAVIAAGFTADAADLLPLVHPALRGDSAALLREDSAALLRGDSAALLREDSAALLREDSAALPHGDTDNDIDDADIYLELAVKAIRAYFDGDVTAIDEVPVAQRSDGDFLGPAWDVLRTVPAGAPVTYAGYARLAGRPAAVRAAAQACARNAVALFVPCHRVVRTDGSLGGYRWGLDVKRWLLEHELAGANHMAEIRS